MKLHLTLQIAQNCWLDGDTIVSYSTDVAQIKEGQIETFGKFSRSTTKHVHKVASLLWLTVVHSGRRPDFWEYHLGVRLKREGSISQAGSNRIFEGMARGLTLEDSCALVWHKLSQKDRDLIAPDVNVWLEMKARVRDIEVLNELGMI